MQPNAPKPAGPRYSLADQAGALAVILREAFGIPFAFYASETGEKVLEPGPQELRHPALDLEPSAVTACAGDGRARVVPLSPNQYRVHLLLYVSGTPVLVAAGILAGRARDAEDQAREQEQLERWARAVSDRLRLSDQLALRSRVEEEQKAQVTAAWQANLTLDDVVRHLRIHKAAEKNQRRVLAAAFGLLDVQALVWVPRALHAPVLLEGEQLLGNADCRKLADALDQGLPAKPAEPLICNDPQATNWGARFPRVTNLLAFALFDQVPLGRMLALNKREGKRELNGSPGKRRVATPQFRSSDAALLSPFVGLLEMHARASSRYESLKELLVGLARALTSAIDAKDAYTAGHSERVARIAIELGREMALSPDDLSDVYLAGLLHDVGKIGIRDAVLTKPGPLTPDEWEHIQQHVVIGKKILEDLHAIGNLIPGVLYHHERWDGQGYPEGLAGENIPFLARLLAVADAYDAMSTARPYRQSMPPQRVEEILAQGAGTQWDPRVVEAFKKCRNKVRNICQRGVGESLSQAIDGALRAGGNGFLWKEDSVNRTITSSAAGSV